MQTHCNLFYQLSICHPYLDMLSQQHRLSHQRQLTTSTSVFQIVEAHQSWCASCVLRFHCKTHPQTTTQSGVNYGAHPALQPSEATTNTTTMANSPLTISPRILKQTRHRLPECRRASNCPPRPQRWCTRDTRLPLLHRWVGRLLWATTTRATILYTQQNPPHITNRSFVAQAVVDNEGKQSADVSKTSNRGHD